MKKIFILLFNLIFIFAFCGISAYAEDAEQVLYNAPDEIRGAIITPGDEFSSSKNQSEDTVRDQIDAVISNIVDFELNTVYLNLQNREGVIYKSDYYPMYTSFDALQYFIDRAKENEIYIYRLLTIFFMITDISAVI